MNRIATVAFLATFIVTLSGCKLTSISDGKIPAGFEQFGHQAEGVYSGHIEESGVIKQKMRSMSLTVAVVDNRLVLTPSTDWLKPGCESKIGHLLSVETSGATLKTAVFAFDAGLCKTEKMGDHLVIRLSNQSSPNPKLEAWVQTDWSQSEDQSGVHTNYVQSSATLIKE